MTPELKKRLEMQALREYRNKYFDIQIEELREHEKIYDDEFRIKVTYNGHQWESLAFNIKEGRTLLEALTRFLSGK